MNMSELNVEMLRGEGGFFVMLLLLVIACVMGMWSEVRWARICNKEYDEGFNDGYDAAWAWMKEQRKVVEFDSADVPDSVIDEINAGYEGYVLGKFFEHGKQRLKAMEAGVDLDTCSAGGSTGAEGFEAAHRGEIF